MRIPRVSGLDHSRSYAVARRRDERLIVFWCVAGQSAVKFFIIFQSFMRRVTKRVSGLLPSTTWMNTLLGESQTIDDASSSNENDDQPPFKKLCTSNNTFTNVNNRTSVESNSTDNHRSSRKRIQAIPMFSFTLLFNYCYCVCRYECSVTRNICCYLSA